MTVFAVSMVKDEADVVTGTIRHLLDEGVDEFIVSDNNSTDGTLDLLADLARDTNRVTVLQDHDPAYYQSVKMTRLGDMAARAGAEWVVPFDADEIWSYRGDRLAGVLRGSEADVVTGELFHHFPTAVDDPGDDPFRTITWRQREPALLPKVAIRWRSGTVIEQGNHGVTFPDGYQPRVHAGVEIRHFPHRTAEQFVRKARNGAAAYAATDLPDHVGAHWRGYGVLLDRHGPEALEEVFRQHFWFLSPADSGLVLDPAPYMRWR